MAAKIKDALLYHILLRKLDNILYKVQNRTRRRDQLTFSTPHCEKHDVSVEILYDLVLL